MNNQLKIKEVIEKITAFCLVKGVQPDELVTAIFDDEYDSVETIKKNKMVYLIITYKETSDDGVNIIKMKYVYNHDKQLQLVEQRINSSPYRVQWDRSSKLNALLDELSSLVSKNNSSINKVKESIPYELRGVVYPKLKIAC